ncbi:alpha-ketoglutarate-dependent dioxygenase AlkB family protein [Methylocaldum szegediense]|uniref:alpha-ketoglutarate-dependent dioxygenase AlkB family protein n=1 Tax=Methylocaldum szegediense TaxID=73780 RepID=UPI0004085D61|nr:alpha-ketoglutarate-dependent dioxygenase AlkB [Methylocaldum szegediense]
MINLAPRDGELYFVENFVPRQEADSLHGLLRRELAWREEEIIMFDRRVKVPRLVCWYGDAGAVYRYSGVDHMPLPWTEALLTLKERIERFCGRRFNSVLGNLYRDGRDSIGWHADKEKELGPNPFIASLSFGAERLFKLRHNKTGETLEIALTHGSLLLMGGSLQHGWRHAVPKAREPKTERINLTFRTILF